jgi:NADPH:quinone reductase
MHAVVISQYRGPEVLARTVLPDPEPAADEVRIRVKAFGLNHVECYFRSGAWGDVARVTGIECASVLEADRSGSFPVGSSVVASSALPLSHVRRPGHISSSGGSRGATTC